MKSDLHKFMISVSHPTGNRNVRAVLASFNQEGMLAEFQTTIAANPEAYWIKFLPSKLKKEWLRRNYPLSSKLIKTSYLLEMSRLIFPKIGLGNFTEKENSFANINSVYKQIDTITAKSLKNLAKKKDIKAVYAYEDSALETFTEAKNLGLKCIYDLPIAYWQTSRRLMMEEAERLPEWAQTLGGGIKDSEEKLKRKTRELELADMVVGPGKFVIDSLPDWANDKKIIIAPFGSPRIDFKNVLNLTENENTAKPLRVLFVGSMGQRKGLGDLFEAFRILKSDKIELVVMGSLLAPMEFYKSQLKNFIHEPGRSNDQVLELMRTFDVFCLPSIVEGRALVIQEAMSQGLPIIITPNSGGEDLVIEGKTGFLVPIRSPEIIAEKLRWFMDNRDKLPEMKRQAQIHSQSYTWENYGSKIIRGIKDLVQ